MPNPVADYLSDLHQSLGAGTPETSGYPALRNLLTPSAADEDYFVEG